MRRSLSPSVVLLFVAVALFVWTFIMSDHSIDIHLHDTYFVVSVFHLFLPVELLLGLFAIIYHWLRNFSLVSALTWLHIATTCLALLSTFLPLSLTNVYGSKPRSYESYAEFIDLTNKQGFYLTAILLALIIAQLLFLANVIAGLMRGRKAQLQP